MGNHAVADAAAGETLRFGAAEDAQDIVLRGAEACGLDQLFGFQAERVGGGEDGDEDAVLEGSGGAGFFGARTHEGTVIVITTIVKRKICRSSRGPCCPPLAVSGGWLTPRRLLPNSCAAGGAGF